MEFSKVSYFCIVIKALNSAACSFPTTLINVTIGGGA